MCRWGGDCWNCPGGGMVGLHDGGYGEAEDSLQIASQIQKSHPNFPKSKIDLGFSTPEQNIYQFRDRTKLWKNLSKYLLRVKRKNTLSSCELVICQRWVIIYAALVVEKRNYIYIKIYTFFFFFFPKDGLIVFAELFPSCKWAGRLSINFKA